MSHVQRSTAQHETRASPNVTKSLHEYIHSLETYMICILMEHFCAPPHDSNATLVGIENWLQGDLR